MPWPVRRLMSIRGRDRGLWRFRSHRRVSLRIDDRAYSLHQRPKSKWSIHLSRWRRAWSWVDRDRDRDPGRQHSREQYYQCHHYEQWPAAPRDAREHECGVVWRVLSHDDHHLRLECGDGYGLGHGATTAVPHHIRHRPRSGGHSQPRSRIPRALVQLLQVEQRRAQGLARSETGITGLSFAVKSQITAKSPKWKWK
jgi:hypothetical protein